MRDTLHPFGFYVEHDRGRALYLWSAYHLLLTHLRQRHLSSHRAAAQAVASNYEN